MLIRKPKYLSLAMLTVVPLLAASPIRHSPVLIVCCPLLEKMDGAAGGVEGAVLLKVGHDAMVGAFVTSHEVTAGAVATTKLALAVSPVSPPLMSRPLVGTDELCCMVLK